MLCPACKTKLKVTNSRSTGRDGNETWREFICIKCKEKYFSFEKLEVESIKKGFRNPTAVVNRLTKENKNVPSNRK